MSWIQTYTGKKFDLLDPQPDMICIEDIAHALSNLCRFTGHCRDFYSVAQHSVFVANTVVTNQYRLWALLHDATEAYVADMSSPLKRLIPDYQEIEARVWRAIAERFGLPLGPAAEIKHFDMIMLLTERRDLMGPPVEPWYEELEALSDQLLVGQIQPWTPHQAKSIFLSEYKRHSARND